MTLHHPLPVAGAVEARIVRLGADGSRVEQHLRTQEGHDPRRFGEPLVPADPDPDRGHLGVPDAKARIPLVEVELLLVAGPVRDVALAVGAEHAPVGVDHGQRVEVGVVGALEEAHRQDHMEFGREPAHAGQKGMALERVGKAEIAPVLVLAEVRRLEQLLQEHDPRTPSGSLAHEPLGPGDVVVTVPAAGHLRCRDGHLTHWVFPPEMRNRPYIAAAASQGKAGGLRLCPSRSRPCGCCRCLSSAASCEQKTRTSLAWAWASSRTRA